MGKRRVRQEFRGKHMKAASALFSARRQVGSGQEPLSTISPGGSDGSSFGSTLTLSAVFIRERSTIGCRISDAERAIPPVDSVDRSGVVTLVRPLWPKPSVAFFPGVRPCFARPTQKPAQSG